MENNSFFTYFGIIMFWIVIINLLLPSDPVDESTKAEIKSGFSEVFTTVFTDNGFLMIVAGFFIITSIPYAVKIFITLSKDTRGMK